MNEIADEIIFLLKSVHLLSMIHSSKRNFSNEIKEVQDKFLEFTESQDFRSNSNHLANQYLKCFKIYVESLEKVLKPDQPFEAYQEVKLKNRLFKAKVILNHLPSAFSLDRNDFRCLAEDHPRNQAIREVTKTRSECSASVKSKEKQFFKLYKSLLASAITYLKYQKSNFSCMLTGFNVFYYLLHPKESIQEIRLFETTSELESLILVWNINDTSMLRKLQSLGFPRITQNCFIFVPRLFSSILDEDQSKTPESLKSFTLVPDLYESQVAIRVLSPWNIGRISNYPDSQPSDPLVEVEAVIIEFHGGALIAQSSFSHQCYTIRWANELDLPVFSVEYRLAPQHKFPAGLEDAWQAYRWLVTYSESFLRLKAKKVILAGDSAGGNIIIAICLKAIQSGVRVPDGLLAVYPCVNWDYSRVSLGLIRSLKDPLLPYKLFNEFPRYYVNDSKDMKSFLVSPLNYATDHCLKSFPRTKVLITLDDPLASDTVEFVDRLLINGVDVEVFEYPGFVHGSLMLAVSNPDYLVFFSDSILMLRRLVFE